MWKAVQNDVCERARIIACLCQSGAIESENKASELLWQCLQSVTRRPIAFPVNVSKQSKLCVPYFPMSYGMPYLANIS